ncbi:HesA/MoeB/ThiF family protein, partial [Candidatus Micrarchaeota archaeon]|nr:HesA/MoeB/ThiF family protein [Candidatus Micrarchaeota archaeon]
MNQRFLCQEKVIGQTQEKISKASIAVVGVGGTGCNSALLLAQLGVRKVKLIDPDVVELFNLPRQPLFTDKDIGRSKSRAAAEKLETHGVTEFLPVQELLEEKNVSKLLSGVHVVLDCTDNYAARKTINDFCLRKKIPWIYSGAIRDKAMLSTIIPGKSPCFNCFAVKPQTELSCAEEGVIATSTALAAALQVQELINLLRGKPQLAGKILFVSLSNLFFDVFSLRFSCT